jgi:peroxiredoxin Q/BCP
VVKVGQAAPDFELESDTGETVRFGDYRGRRLVLFFYSKDATPG